jgi:hypothetical protein
VLAHSPAMGRLIRGYDRLLAEQARAAVLVTDAHHTPWNRSVELLGKEDEGDGLPGGATGSGTTRCGWSKFCRRFRQAGQQHGDRTLRRYPEAIQVVRTRPSIAWPQLQGELL